MTADVLDAPFGALSLSRPGGGPSLRAWDAADELLLLEASGRLDAARKPRVLVVDDQFGALSLGLQSFAPDVVADSALLAGALEHNTAGSPAGAGDIQVHSWLNPPRGPYDVVVLRIPRQADYLAWLLRWVNGVLAPEGLLLAGGMIKHLPDRSVDVFAGLVVTETVTPARKKARVVICRAGAEGLDGWGDAWKGYALDGVGKIQALPAVFSRDKLDIGTRLFLPHVQDAVSGLASGARVLDLACGNGVVGACVLARRQDLELTCADVSSQAIISAQHNVTGNFPEARVHCMHADGIPGSAGLFDRILLNPPFHEGGVVGDHIALRLFRQAADHLLPGGRLLVVGNRHLGYHRSLRRYFSGVRQLDASPKFVVLEASQDSQ